MDKRFLLPLLIVAIAVILLVFIAPLIPVWENDFLPIKKMDILGSLLQKPDLGAISAEAVEVASKQESVEALIPLDGFVSKMNALKKGQASQLRIAYFGDSIIEGDFLSGKLRKNLQDDCGGNGVGLVGITSIVNEYRKTIRHSFSNNWETISFMSKGSATLGIMGHTYIPRNWQMVESTVDEAVTPMVQDSTAGATEGTATATVPKKVLRKVNVGGPAWVQYEGVSFPGGAQTFEHIRLFYSHAPDASNIRVSYDGGAMQSLPLVPGEGLQVMNLSAATPVKKIRLEFSSSQPIHVYGLSFDSAKGLFVDNISVRGYSGMDFHRIPQELLSSFQRALDFDLLILQFGENVTNPKNTDYGFYYKGMLRSIRHLQAAMPGVPILIISAHDRSIRKDTGYQTSPDIPILIKTQSEFAKETGSAFWNLFAAMGGMNSMQTWVNASPSLAARDYTHFTITGAQKVGEMLSGLIRQGSQKVSSQ